MADENVKDEQFPSLEGAPEVEVAKRAADVHEESSDRWRKEFVVLADDWGDTPEQHEANKLFVLEEAIKNGVHPTEEATFDGSEDHSDGVSLRLFYSVACVPAIVHENAPATTVTPHHVLEQKLDGSTSNATAVTEEVTSETLAKKDLPS